MLILVRQRGPLFEAIIRALKNENVEVAGADRLVLTEHIAVMDLMALADALLLPDDDLALAAVLRSPLFGFSDEDLFAIAADRGRSSLHAALSAKIGRAGDFRASRRGASMRLREAARRQSPFAFYASVLGAGGGRQRFLARLGAEANDALDEFLNLALDYERRETPSLQGFVAWLRAARAEVKRDMEIARDEVRVMTVHGAKGLEAPIVILADTMTQPSGPRPPRLLELPDGAVIWAGRKDDDVAPVAAARQAALAEAEDEYRRLLYVAMTRAADRLIICGADGERQRPKGCWYDLVVEPLRPFLHRGATTTAKKSGAIARSRRLRRHGGAHAGGGAGRDADHRNSRPGCGSRLAAGTPGPSLDVAVRGVRGGSRPRVRARRASAGRAAQGAGPRAHRASADAVVARHSAGRAQGRHRALSEKRRRRFRCPPSRRRSPGMLLTILNDLIFAELFAPGSRAEVPIVGRLARQRGAAARRVGTGGPAGGNPRRRADRRLQDRPGGAGAAGRRAETAISASSRFTAPCWAAFTRKKQFAPH